MSLPTEVYAQQSSEYPILGYFKLGMPYSEYFKQQEKLRHDTDKDINGMPTNYVEIGGYNFDVADDNEVELNRSIYDKYDKKLTPTFFATHTILLPDTIDNFNWHTEHLASFNVCTSKMFDDVTYTFGIDNDKVIQVVIPQNHNRLVNIADSLTKYLSKKYGKPKEEYNIPLVHGKQGSLFNGIPLKATIFYTLEPNYLASGHYELLPRAIWTTSNMDIILGINCYGRISLSFIDVQALSHSNLDSLLLKEDTKANVSW